MNANARNNIRMATLNGKIVARVDCSDIIEDKLKHSNIYLHHIYGK